MPTDRFANVVAAASTRSFDYVSRKNLLLRPTGGDSPAERSRQGPRFNVGTLLVHPALTPRSAHCSYALTPLSDHC
eukprot:4531903-Prymnesium_polylepis.1